MNTIVTHTVIVLPVNWIPVELMILHTFTRLLDAHTNIPKKKKNVHSLIHTWKFIHIH